MPVKSRFATRPLADPVKRLVTFTVEGRGMFPYDMLRYDSCWPEASHDVANMVTWDDHRKVTLVGHHEPTEARWKSFRWQVQ